MSSSQAGTTTNSGGSGTTTSGSGATTAGSTTAGSTTAGTTTAGSTTAGTTTAGSTTAGTTTAGTAASPSGVSSTTQTGAAPATTATGGTGTTEEVIVGPDLYSWFIGAFVGLLSLIVLVSTGSILSVLVLLALIALFVSSLVYYGFLDISEYLDDKLTLPPPVTPAAKPAGGPLVGSEVFHIDAAEVDGKGFTYEESQAVCAAFDSELATLEQVVAAYNGGAEWCSYGWTGGGMALYPTQKATWDILQNELDLERRTRCGRPGVNGGYMDPLLRLGVNCYGFKPKGDFKPPAPVPGGDPTAFKEMVTRFKDMMNKLSLAPFSRLRWSGVRAESFVGGSKGSYGTQFQQSFFTPSGVVEHLANGSGDAYVESIATSGGYGGAPYGLRGDIGPTGSTGSRGIQGIRGVQGPQGDQGPQGARGDQGERGAASTVPGPTGPKGSQGDRGEQGPEGAAAATGATGAKGADGRDGPTGPTGQKGEQGRQGVTGPSGAVGSTGARGERGFQGIPGPIEPDLKVQSIQIGDHLLYSVNRKGTSDPWGSELLIQPNTPLNRPSNQLPPKLAIGWDNDRANLWLQNVSWGNDARNWRRLAWGTNDQWGGNNSAGDIAGYGSVARRQPPAGV
jgi:hypothetical protein